MVCSLIVSSGMLRHKLTGFCFLNSNSYGFIKGLSFNTNLRASTLSQLLGISLQEADFLMIGDCDSGKDEGGINPGCSRSSK